MLRRSDLPTGAVTFLFTDVEGSTKLLHELGAEAYSEALAEHRHVLRTTFGKRGGVEVDTQGDAFFYAFPSAYEALHAASEGQEALAAGPIHVRLGLHTGSPLVAEEGYVGHDVHFAARVAAAGHGGQILVSRETRALVADGFSFTSLGSHRLKDVPEPVTIYQLGEHAFPRLKTVANSNLPTPASSFLGREDELYEAGEQLRQTRLFTVTGPGGAGKTRFGLELATRAREERFSDYEDGIYSAFLSSLRDPELVLVTIAVSLGVSEQPGQSVTETLSTHLAGKKLLLLLDNLEHLPEAFTQLSELLSSCAGVTILATSRERLRLQGERIYELPPLSETESVFLFCERAQTEPIDDIRELCARLEGLPLAIELAAARTSVLNPQQILTRLSQRLDFLKGGPDRDPRQETLRATIQWSHDLLTPEEQWLFARLSVFAGGCTLEAAEEVCDACLDTLQSLVEKSLVRFTDDRYWMLETLREFAREQLAERGEGEAIRERHADCYLNLAEELEPPPMGGVEKDWARLRPETDNLRAAIELFSSQPEPSSELRLVGSLFRFWPTVSLVSEGRLLANHALVRSQGADRRLRMKVLYAAALCAIHQDDVGGATRYEEERLAIARSIGDKHAEAVALNDLGIAAHGAGDLDRAEAFLDDAAELAREIGDEHLLVAVANNLGSVALDRGEYQHARELLEEGLAVRAHVGDSMSIAHLLETLGFALLAVGESTLAAERFREGLALVNIVPQLVSLWLDGLSAVAVTDGDATRSAQLSGAAEAIREGAGFLTGRFERDVAQDTAYAAREALGDAAWEAERAKGAAMTVEEAIAYALESGK